MAESGKKIHLRIRRQARPDTQPYWDSYEVDSKPLMNGGSATVSRRSAARAP